MQKYIYIVYIYIQNNISTDRFVEYRRFINTPGRADKSSLRLDRADKLSFIIDLSARPDLDV